MKKLISLSIVAAICAGFATSACGQNSSAAPAPSADTPHKVGLIDMARVFKEYKKFENLREDLKSEIAQSDEQAKAMATELQKLQEEMKTFEQGKPEYNSLEKQLAEKASKFEAFRKVAQRDFLRKESQIYKTVYLEVVDVVKKYSEIYHYTLILRFNSEKIEGSDPQKLIQGLNRQVIFHRPDDNITDSVITYLNRNYPGAQAAQPAGTRTSVKPVGGTRRN